MRVKNSPLFEIASLLVRLDRVASFIVNANHRTVATGADEQLHRIGAICNDGSESGATGRGLVRVMATSGVGNTLMERATNF